LRNYNFAAPANSGPQPADCN